MHTVTAVALAALTIFIGAADLQAAEYCQPRDPGCIPKRGGEVLIYHGERFVERDEGRTQAARRAREEREEAVAAERMQRDAAIYAAQERARQLAEQADDQEIECQTVQHSGVTNPHTGEFYAPSGTSNFVGTRDGTVYSSAGAGGLINTRTGQFLPIVPPPPQTECWPSRSTSASRRREGDDYHRGTRSLNGGMINKRSVEFGGGGR